MATCANDNCSNDPLQSMYAVAVNIDGDMACCPKCKTEYIKQRGKFLNTIVQDDALFNEYMGIKEK